MLAGPDGLVAKLMPFWSARELGTYTVDGAGTDYRWRALAHGAATWAICAGLAYLLFARRLRIERYPEP